MFILFRILVGYHKKEAEYVDLLINNIICFIPALNVDAYEAIVEIYKETNFLLPIRKNRNSQYKSLCQRDFGIDLNRNFEFCWGINNVGSSPDPCNGFYCK